MKTFISTTVAYDDEDRGKAAMPYALRRTSLDLHVCIMSVCGVSGRMTAEDYDERNKSGDEAREERVLMSGSVTVMKTEAVSARVRRIPQWTCWSGATPRCSSAYRLAATSR